LGEIRFDLLLMSAIFIVATFFTGQREKYEINFTTKIILFLMLYVIVTIPFVEWPGSVLQNIENWVKCLAFYYFTIRIIDTKQRLRIFTYAFITVQIIRVIEPVYLHLADGYWGSFASMQNWEYMNRLAGAPHDIINPNGLAHVILTVLAFIYYFHNMTPCSRFMFYIIAPALLYALILTGSRSGMIGLLTIGIMYLYFSKKKILLVSIMLFVLAMSAFYMQDDMKDRYASIFDSSSQNRMTAEGRIAGMITDIELSLRRPIFGHGLGTSLEANANYTGRYQISHNLYAEIAIELGLVGLMIFIAYIMSVIKNIIHTVRIEKKKHIHENFVTSFQQGMITWILMNIVFSFASYGLLSYEWYLFGGLSVVLLRICDTPEGNDIANGNSSDLDSPAVKNATVVYGIMR